ncbi:MAG: transcriptional regulator [Candidatus Aenigmatarchaeota archaeon]|nr:MAG: transcriptional regulator [Candidatus Aenigmarchaeota archaeon]
MKFITLWVPERYLKLLDKLVEDGRYPSRAEAIRMAIRDLLLNECRGEWSKGCKLPFPPCNLDGGEGGE